MYLLISVKGFGIGCKACLATFFNGISSVSKTC